MMLSRSLVEIELRLGKCSKTVLRYTHVVEQLSFSMFPSILSSDFELILWSFFTFWCSNGLLFRDLGGVRKLSWGLLM